MTSPYDETRRPGDEPDNPWVGGGFPDREPAPGGSDAPAGPDAPGAPAPGSEPGDPWAEDEARRRAEQEDRWVSQDGGLGPIPSRTWTKGNTRVTVGGCCLPLPIGCLTTLVAAGVVAAVGAARRRS